VDLLADLYIRQIQSAIHSMVSIKHRNPCHKSDNVMAFTFSLVLEFVKLDYH